MTQHLIYLFVAHSSYNFFKSLSCVIPFHLTPKTHLCYPDKLKLVHIRLYPVMKYSYLYCTVMFTIAEDYVVAVCLKTQSIYIYIYLTCFSVRETSKELVQGVSEPPSMNCVFGTLNVMWQRFVYHPGAECNAILDQITNKTLKMRNNNRQIMSRSVVFLFKVISN